MFFTSWHNTYQILVFLRNFPEAWILLNPLIPLLYPLIKVLFGLESLIIIMLSITILMVSAKRSVTISVRFIIHILGVAVVNADCHLPWLLVLTAFFDADQVLVFLNNFPKVGILLNPLLPLFYPLIKNLLFGEEFLWKSFNSIIFLFVVFAKCWVAISKPFIISNLRVTIINANRHEPWLLFSATFQTTHQVLVFLSNFPQVWIFLNPLIPLLYYLFVFSHILRTHPF